MNNWEHDFTEAQHVGDGSMTWLGLVIGAGVFAAFMWAAICFFGGSS